MIYEIQNFERDLKLNTNLMPITINAHLGNINRIFRILHTVSPTNQQIENYVLELKFSQYSYNHIVNNIVTIEKYTSFNGRKLIFAKPKKPKRLIKDFLSEAEISLMISSCRNIREKGILSLLAYSGIRNSELCNLKVSDLDLGENTLRVVKGKNCKDRIVNISSECTKILIKYLSKYPRGDSDFLFTTLVKNNKYQPGDLRKIVKVLSRRVGIDRRIFPHMFRTSLASNLLKRGAGIITIKEQLGHSDLSSTLIYLSSCPQRAKSEYDHFKPAYV